MSNGEDFQKALDGLRDAYDRIARQAAIQGYETVHARHPNSQMSQACRRSTCGRELEGHAIKLVQIVDSTRAWVHEVCP